MNRFRCELGAYRNLFSYGVCERGFVLQCYGYCDNFKRSEFPSDIVSHFENDTEDPQALFLEYLVDPEVLNCVNYTAERMQKAIAALQEVHNAHVLHEDLYPKNILIVPGDPERVLVTDFDVSETFGDTRPWHPIFGDVVENEMEVFIDLGRLLVSVSIYAVVEAAYMVTGRGSAGRTATKYQVLLIIASES